MTHQEIITMARYAGLSITPPRAGQYNGGSVGCDVVGLTKFAALIAAMEREECAQLVEAAQPWGRIAKTAAAIRARAAA